MCVSVGKKTARDSLFGTFLVKVKVRSVCNAQFKPPPMMMMMHNLRQKQDGENTCRKCKYGPLRECEPRLSCYLIWPNRVGPPKWESSGLSRHTQAALLAEAARHGCGCCCQSVTASSLSPLSRFCPHCLSPPLPHTHTLSQADGFSLLHFPFACLCHNLFRLLKSTTIQYRNIK